MSIPDYLVQGEEARLIPVSTGNHRERAACSVFLAVLRIVEPFAAEILRGMDQRVGRWSAVSTFTEVVFANQPDELNCRHDGLLILDTGRREWRALIECKIGNARIEPDQVAQYYRVARSNGIDAVITISNQLTSRPWHLPYEPPREVRNIDLFHWSWSHLVALADRLLREDREFDSEQRLILDEMVRYFDYDTSEVKCFTQMGPSWAPLVQRVGGNAPINKNDLDVIDAVQCWQQAQEAVCVRLSRKLQQPVIIRLPRIHREDRQAWVADDIAEFIQNGCLGASLEVPDLAGPLVVLANTMGRTLICQLLVKAPLDRQRYTARLRWLLNQFPEDCDPNVRINFIWERGQRSQASLEQLRTNPEAGRPDGFGIAPISFEILVVTELAARFANPRNFVAALGDAVANFHDTVAKHIWSWEPARDPEPASASKRVLNDPEPELTEGKPRQVVRQGELNGRSFSIFDDGSFEIDTGKGIKRFKDFAELSAAAAAKNGSGRLNEGHAEPQ